MPSISKYYRFIHISFTCLLFFFSPIHTTEVTVVTKTGKSFTGIVTDSNDQYIFINAQGSQLTILKELIVSIDSGVCKNISSDTGISGVFPETEKRQLIQNNSASEPPVIIIDSALYHNSFIIIASPENSKISINGKGFGTSPVKLAHVKPDTYSVEEVSSP